MEYHDNIFGMHMFGIEPGVMPEKAKKRGIAMMEWLRRILLNGIVQAVLWVVLGVILMVWPAASLRILCYFLGALLLAQGIIQIVTAVKKESGTWMASFGLCLGVVITVLGGWAILFPDTVKQMIPVLLAVIVLIHGARNLASAFRLRRFGYSKWWLGLVFGLLTLTAGIVILWHPAFFADILMAFTGACLIYDGISDFILQIVLLRMTKEP